MDTWIILVSLPFIVLWSARLTVCRSDHPEISDQSLRLQEPCFPCKCENGTALCDNLNLTYIPRLSKGIYNITFTGNSLPSITEGKFSNISHLNLKDLDLSDNNIRYISPKAFSTLRCLKHLCLRSNTIPIWVLSESFLGLSNVTSLNLKNMHLNNISSGFFEHMPTLSLQYLDISHNWLGQFNFDILTKFHDLKSLRVGHNRIKTVQWKYYPALEELSLDDCNIQDVPTFCSANGSYFPNLKRLFFSHNFLSIINSSFFACLNRLELVSLNENPIRAIFSGTFAFLPNLQKVFMHHMELLHSFDRYAFNNTNLRTLYLRGSRIRLNTIDADAFAGCYGLQILDLSYNQLNTMNDSFFNQMFRDLHSLTYLSLLSTQLKAVPVVIPGALFQLERLYMNKNKLQSLPRNMLYHLSKLTHLDVSFNFISTIHEDTFPEQNQKTLKYINLKNNSFSCSCEMEWFVQWIQRDYYKFAGYPSSYTCAYPPEFKYAQLSDLSFSEQYCLFQKTVYVMLLGFISLGVVLVAVLSIIYKCRWKLRYLLYLINHLEIYKLRDDQNCTYDGFVVYTPSDTAWIIEHLIPRLEERNALKLCIHERDFDVGGAIVDNIVESVETSRKILIVLSINTLQSEWCQFEMNLAQRRAVGGTHTIVVVLLSDIPGRLFSSSINAILEEHPCVIWPAPQEDETARDMFWEQLLGHFRS